MQCYCFSVVSFAFLLMFPLVTYLAALFGNLSFFKQHLLVLIFCSPGSPDTLILHDYHAGIL
jgi:hypothetical protein